MVIEDVIPCEDGHAQERSLLTDVLPTIRPRDLLVDDRNLCTFVFLFGVMARRAYDTWPVITVLVVSCQVPCLSLVLPRRAVSP
jgi:hypothetical protein